MRKKKGDYDVGHGKPPKHGQFPKGTSGNPKGRPKGSKNFGTEVREELAQPVPIKEGGRVSNVSTRRAVLKQLRADAFAGKRHAIEKLLSLAERYDVEDADNAAEAELSNSDAEILERYHERILRAHDGAGEPPVDDKEEAGI